MALYVECGEAAGPGLPVEIGNPIWSESVAAGAATVNTVPSNNGRSYVVTVTSDEDGYVKEGASAAAAPRRRVKSGVARSFVVAPGSQISYATS